MELHREDALAEVPALLCVTPEHVRATGLEIPGSESPLRLHIQFSDEFDDFE
jgi:hypothetical protein